VSVILAVNVFEQWSVLCEKRGNGMGLSRAGKQRSPRTSNMLEKAWLGSVVNVSKFHPRGFLASRARRAMVCHTFWDLDLETPLFSSGV
jgi:hypothetical protein